MSIGAEIARARNAAGITHAQLAERTRIRTGVIQAIERDDFSMCGGDVFARGHVKAIASALDLDPAPLLEQLGAVQSPTNLAQVEPDRLDIWELRRRSIAPSEWKSTAILIAIAVGIIGAIAFAARDTGATDLVPAPAPTSSASASPTAAAELPIGAPEPTPPQETAPAVVTGEIVLQLDANATSWIRLTNELGTLFEGTMAAGESKVFASDSDVQVRIGNAAAITLMINGETYDNLGGAGEVYSQTISIN